MNRATSLPHGIVFVARREHADAPHPPILLRTRRDRPRRRHRAHAGDELAPSHSITSSARPSSARGKVRPSALAVFMLIISSTLVACCTGRSAGLAPLRIRLVWPPTRRLISTLSAP